MTWRCPRQVCRTSKNGKTPTDMLIEEHEFGVLGRSGPGKVFSLRQTTGRGRSPHLENCRRCNWESRSERKQQYHILSPNTLTVAAAHYVQRSLGCRTHSQPHHLSRAQRVLLYTLNPWSAQSPLFCNLSMRKHTPNAQHSATLAAYLGRDDVDLLCKALDEHSVSFI